jgi:FkbH-like protein
MQQRVDQSYAAFVRGVARGRDITPATVSDRFGPEGIVGAVWVRCGTAWHVENLVLSCRVLGRGVELAIAGWLVRQARAAGAARLEGRYVQSAKNQVASGFWEKAGFLPTDDHEVFAGDLARAVDLVPTWIHITERKTV